MQILLREAHSRLLKAKDAGWTPQPEEAVHFTDIQAAGEEARNCGELDVEVVLKYQDPDCELALNPAYCV